ncbi:ABC transporter ATP-binding protein [Micromonospora sp. DT44]|uniref:ABC transporter ATP-binding protein n=1 Tax=Micromonospora sp. DT44 TaxID=3393439 RepID=UPI003CEFF0A8
MVDDVRLVVAAGEFFSLLGPSGCGKTTLLRMIAGLLPPSDGQILLGGRDVTNLPAHQRPVSTVFQDYALFPHLSVAENVAFGLRAEGVRGGAVLDRVALALEQVGLTGRDKARPRDLSGGQRQRVALARSLVLRPQVLLLDEPLGALDLALRRQMQSLLKQLQRSTGITFIHVTHDQTEAFAMSDRVAVMAAGRIAQVGPPREIYRNPASHFVASFVGEVNRLPARVMADPLDGRVEVQLADRRTLRVPASADLRKGCEVDLLLRPEDVSIGPPAAGSISTPATVVDVTFEGPSTVVVATTADGTELTVRLPSSRADELTGVTALHLSWRSQDSWALPRASAGGAHTPANR